MPKLLLTDISIRALNADVRTDYWDTKTPGFGVRVGPRTKTFIAKHGGTRQTIGAYPAVTLQDARRKAFSLKAEGKPIQAGKLTFKEAYERFKTGHIALKKERTQHDYTRVMDKYSCRSSNDHACEDHVRPYR
jgi:hypothetical protein